MTPAVILAGGLARRMGGGGETPVDKARLMLNGRPLIAHVIDRIQGQVDALALNANGDPARFADLGLPVLPDGVPGRPGPLAGVLAGLDWAAGMGAESVISVAADTPYPPADLVRGLRAARGPSGLALARAGGRPQPIFGLWPVALRDDLRAALGAGTRKVLDWTDRHAPGMADFPAEAFFNVNTPEDLARGRA